MNLWFTENIPIIRGFRQQIQIKNTLHLEKSQYQQISVYETENFGKMLVLDDIIMFTEFDEYAYHEMITHPALFSHEQPKTVLVIGGGDGGTVRELIKHIIIEEIHLCEIDERVIEVCKRFFPQMTESFSDKRVKIQFADGVNWVKNRKNFYDIIIVDSTDPIGPAEALFEFDFYKSCRDALKEDGILVAQAEHLMLHKDIIKELFAFGEKLYPIRKYYYTHVPTYPGGGIGFVFFSLKYENWPIAQNRRNGMKFRYWSEEIQKSAFILPEFLKNCLL